MAKWTMSDLLPLGIIGRICLKAPPNTITFLPKFLLATSLYLLIMSFKDLSKVSKQNLHVIGASSHMINCVNFKSSASSLPCSMFQIDFSCDGAGILNFECVVLPL